MYTPLTEDEVREIRERASKAIEGPWEYFRDTFEPAVHSKLEDGCQGKPVCRLRCWSGVESWCNAEFIAHSRTDIPRLLEEREYLLKCFEAIVTFAREREGLSVYLDMVADKIENEVLNPRKEVTPDADSSGRDV
jgi:hypothetical protein